MACRIGSELARKVVTSCRRWRTRISSQEESGCCDVMSSVADSIPVEKRLFSSGFLWSSSEHFKSSTSMISPKEEVVRSGLRATVFTRSSQSTYSGKVCNDGHCRIPKSFAHSSASSVIADVDFNTRDSSFTEASKDMLAAGMDDPIDWKKQRVKLTEFDDMSRSQPVDPPQILDVDPADIYIPVKAFYISRR